MDRLHIVEKLAKEVIGFNKPYNRMTISELADVIASDWKDVYFGAKPYLQAMYSLDSVNDNYGMDTGYMIVAYFLSNASKWRGDVAKEVKKELKKRLK